MEFIINKTQYKIKLPISELITLQLNKPIIQRDIDLEIVQHITDYQIKRFNEKGSFLFVGDLTIAVRGENIYLIDGQHRYYSILTDLYKIDSTYMVSLNYVRVNNNGDNNNLPTLEEVFILLNKHTPIPEYVLECCDGAIYKQVYKQIIDEFRHICKREYKSYISVAKKPRAPHIMLDIICNKIMKDSIILFQYIKTGKQLFEYFEYINKNLWINFDPLKVGNKIKDKPLYAYVQYNLTKENDWTSSLLLINQFIAFIALTVVDNDVDTVDDIDVDDVDDDNVNNVDNVDDVDDVNNVEKTTAVKATSRKATSRKTIPKKIRIQLWEQYYGKQYSALCLICKDTLFFNNFEVGHIIASACGGSDKIDNLKPICSQCNKAMGIENMNTYIEKYYN